MNVGSIPCSTVSSFAEMMMVGNDLGSDNIQETRNPVWYINVVLNISHHSHIVSRYDTVSLSISAMGLW